MVRTSQNILSALFGRNLIYFITILNELSGLAVSDVTKPILFEGWALMPP
jgi:hypothetical protein